jgi:hypothetical protein
MLICSMSGQRAVVAPLRDKEHCTALALCELFSRIVVPVGETYGDWP